MASSYQHSILWRGEDPTKTKFKPSFDGTKRVERYRKGQVPQWAKEDVKEKAKEPEPDLRQARKRRREREAAAVVLEEKKEDVASSRLARLQRSSGGETSTERLLRHRHVAEAAVLEEADKKDEEDEEKLELKQLKEEDLEPKAAAGLAELRYDEVSGSEEEDIELRALRRERAREQALEKRRQEEDVLRDELDKDEQDEVLDEEESEYESESEDDPRHGGIMMKPVFVSKANRDTVREKELHEKQEAEMEQNRQNRQLEKKAESKMLVIDKISEEVEAERLAEMADDRSDVELMDDDDEKNEAEEYEMWKIRELKRIKRDKEDRLTRQKEIEFVLKRRGMTDQEREEDDKKLDAINPSREKVKQFNFMQKYYHRGGFFQDKATEGAEPLYLRDYHEPLEEEKYDKSLLPKAMQLRRGEFGKKGQVKHSHLTDVDTTDMSAAWSQSSKQVQRYQEKMAGAKGVMNFDRPSLKK
eukprot:TRINITY_DN41353_c0_g1_i1.p1 TRINITY_DN41353_c0_g1~~TRINITY_DN41353_c0_g1_i1.p1  ORF type:complete len:473 (+),score=167.93 TRINITY_DN41353_c0_g1_i1:146-1564(+)